MSAASQPAWKPPAADAVSAEQGWKPPVADAQAGPAPQSNLSRAAHAFYEGSGAKTIMDLIGGSNRFDPAMQEKALETAKGVLKGLAGEPARVVGQLSETGRDILAGHLAAATYHLAGSFPLVGAQAQGVAQDLEEKQYPEAIGHAAGLLLPFVVGGGAPEIKAGAQAVADASAKTLSRAKTSIAKPGTSQAMKGAAQVVAGGGAALSGHPFTGGAVAMRGVENLTQGIAKRASAVPAVWDEIARGPAPTALPEPPAVQSWQGGAPLVKPEYVPPPVIPPPAAVMPPLRAPGAAPASPSGVLWQGGTPLVKPEYVPPPVIPPPAAVMPPLRAPGAAPSAPPAPVEVPAPPAPVVAPAVMDRAAAASDLARRLAQEGIESGTVPPSAEVVGDRVVIPSAESGIKTTPQAEAAMARKAPAPTEAPTSRYTSTGERKSPQLRAAEITGANRTAKASRFVEALQKTGISAEAAKEIEAGRLGPTAIQGGATPRWGNIADFLGENEPSPTTIKEIMRQLKKTKESKP